MKEKILQQLNWTEDFILRKKHGSASEVKAGALIDAILQHEVIPIACKELGISERTFKRMMVEVLPDVRLTGKRTWKYYFLNLLDKKKCSRCFEIKDLDQFHNTNQSASLTGKVSICKACDLEWARFRQKHYPEQHRAANAKRRAAELNAIPSWADLGEIAKIYLLCPEGYHVDHEIPLQGPNVCGLHVEYNLQYLTAEENLKKGNKLREEQ